MNRKFFTTLLMAITGTMAMSASVVIDEKTYDVDTISYRSVGPGITYGQYRLDEFPLNVYILHMDLNNQYNRVETTQANNLLGTQERLVDAYNRHKNEGKKPIAACNGNFWVVSGHGEPWISFMLGTPFGGVVYNDTVLVNTNTTTDLWNGGPQRTGSAAIDKDKLLYLGRKLWSGTVTNPRFDAPVQLSQINKRCLDNEVAIFTKHYGRDRSINSSAGSHFVFMNLKDGSDWGVNSDMTFIVQEVKLDEQNTQILGNDYDLCLTCLGDANKTQIAKLQPGDEVVINQGWEILDDTPAKPLIENLVEGNAVVMLNGELTERNYDETYNSQVYSRCAYGASADRKHLYMIVIDKSTNEIGVSAGCSTSQMCQILKGIYPEVWNVVNFDAGGSAQMLVDGEVVNKTTESYPRAVATGWMLYSTAPGNDTQIASIAFDMPHIKVPTMTSFKPRILGYNQYGELIDEDLQGVTLSCDDNVGNTDGDRFIAGTTPAIGVLTAEYNGATVSTAVTTVNAGMNIRIKPEILIDGTREYPVEVSTTINRETFHYDSSYLEWTNSDETVASLQNGILKGLDNGITEISCQAGEYSDNTSVRVEIVEQPRIDLEWTGWELQGSSGAKNMSLSEDGVLSVDYSGGRGPYISMSKDARFYSLPDRIFLEFTSTIPFSNIRMNFRSNDMGNTNYVTFDNDGAGYEAATRYKIELPIDLLGDPSDLIIYPIHLNEIRFTPRSSGYTSGANTVTFHGLYAEYDNYSSVSAIDATGSFAVYPNPVGNDGSFSVYTGMEGKATIKIYNQAGMLVFATETNMQNGSAMISGTGLQPGLYLIQVAQGDSNMISKIIFK